MKKSKNILSFVFIVLISFIFNITFVDAASCRIGISAPSNAVVGNTFKVTVNVSGGQPIGAWEYTLSYDSSKVRLNSGQLHIVDYGNGSKKSASYTYSFTALKSGAATFKAVNASVLDYASDNECLSSNSSATVNMKTQAEIEASYSRNNNLGSLSVEGTSLSPEFNSEITEYKATLPVDTTKAIIIATPEDRTASISGAGEIDVVDGINKVEITVTAQHGEKKVYTIDLTVEELDPIKVEVDNNEYSIVRKKGQVENIPVGFTETMVKIEGQDINAYKSSITKTTLVALKDSEGIVDLYIYNSANKTFKKFVQSKSDLVNLILLDGYEGKTPSDFNNVTFKYDNNEFKAYRLKGDTNKDYYIVYAQDMETGNSDFYIYDKNTKKFNLYPKALMEVKNNQLKYIILVAIVSISLIVLRILFKILGSIFISKDKKIRKYQKKIGKLKNELNEKEDKEDHTFDIEEIDDKPIIKQVDEKEYKVPKKTKKQKLKEIKEAKDKLDKTKTSYRRVSLEEDE